ncbi:MULTISPECIES: hypothetical protein [Acinetobacter]
MWAWVVPICAELVCHPEGESIYRREATEAMDVLGSLQATI